jgi:uncharacterized protein YrrD
MQLKKVKIIGDGTSRGTKVIDAETGEKLSAVQKVEFSIECGMVGLVRVTQLYRLGEIDVDGLVPVAELPSASD